MGFRGGCLFRTCLHKGGYVGGKDFIQTFAEWTNKQPHIKTNNTMLKTNKTELSEKFNFLISQTKRTIGDHFPSIYSKTDLEFILNTILENAHNIVDNLEEVEETATEEQTFTLKEVSEALGQLDFDNDDFATIDCDEYGHEVRVRAVSCPHELEDYVQTEVIEYLNNLNS